MREPSEFPQYQTYQLYVRVVVRVGVLKHTVLWALKNHGSFVGALAHQACRTV